MQQTPNLHTILTYAREEAGRLGCVEIMPDHFMLGILRLEAGKAFELLMQAGMDPVAFKQKIDERLLQSTSTQTQKLSRASERIIRLTGIEARNYQAETCGSVHLLMGMLRDRINFPAMYLEQQHGIDYECIERLYPKPDPLPQGELTMEETPQERETTIHIFGPEVGGKKKSKTDTPALTKYGRDLTLQAAKGELDPVIGRQVEIDRVVQILSRRKKNNPILIGEPGVGKSAIVEGLALRIAGKEIPMLEGKRIISLDIASMVAGTTYRGQFEERIKTVIKELNDHPEVILFVDEIHTLIGAGNAQGSLDAANILKPALARGEVQCIGATTLSEYRTSIEKDGALERRFQKVIVQPTSLDETYTILTRLSDTYAQFHHVHYTPEALRACVNLTDRYITDRYFPDKAIDAMDEAGACKMEIRKQALEDNKSVNDESAAAVEITESDVARVVSQMSGVPVQRVAQAEGERLRQMSAVLQQRVIGQDEAVQKVVKAIQRSRMGLRDPRKPIGTFFLLGPTGVGKTHLAQCLAEEMFGSRNAIVRFDMSEYMEKHTVSLLVGAPPGYIAHEDGGKLTEAVRRKPYSIVLFDEIEKAHPDIFNVLLQVMDEGRLTDRQGHVVDFKNTIIILTSNVGTRQLNDFGAGIGFGADDMDAKASERMLTKALQRTFPPEFVNRLDNVIVFHRLSDDALAQILRLELNPLLARVEAMGYQLELTEETQNEILRLARDTQYGARPLKRAIQTLVEDPLTDMLLAGEIDNKIIKI
ncbi:MAG: ATP-dependent Clp protease ATP-binding subunit [Paludibacteraceae bacterium]|nr:ATP-dependent Clp protease ATP-binding subunit [Paludibacteraceae bacterium]